MQDNSVAAEFVDYPATQFSVDRSGAGNIWVNVMYPETEPAPSGIPATIYEMVDGIENRLSWDSVGMEEAHSENINYRATQIRVVADNGFEWVVALVDKPLEQGIASMDFELPMTSSDIVGGKITLKNDATYEDLAQHLKATLVVQGGEHDGEIVLLNVENVGGNWCFADDTDQYNEIHVEGKVVTFIDEGTAGGEYQSIDWV